MIHKLFSGLEFIKANNEPIIEIGVQKERVEQKNGWGKRLFGNVVLVSIVHRDNQDYNKYYAHEKDIEKYCISKKYLRQAIKKKYLNNEQSIEPLNKLLNKKKWMK